MSVNNTNRRQMVKLERQWADPIAKTIARVGACLLEHKDQLKSGRLVMRSCKDFSFFKIDKF